MNEATIIVGMDDQAGFYAMFANDNCISSAKTPAEAVQDLISRKEYHMSDHYRFMWSLCPLCGEKLIFEGDAVILGPEMSSLSIRSCSGCHDIFIATGDGVNRQQKTFEPTETQRYLRNTIMDYWNNKKLPEPSCIICSSKMIEESGNGNGRIVKENFTCPTCNDVRLYVTWDVTEWGEEFVGGG